jgi:16S rRNA C967 or C1407 C5-methylase (RsmB/RsmF family)
VRLPEFLRRLTDPVVDRIPVPIVTGPNRGLLWSLASAGGGYATGRRAAAQVQLVASITRPGDVVWDVGAHHGFVTLCAARRVGATGEVHSFEPSARNLKFLRRHLRWNKIENTVVHPCALSSFDGEFWFGGTGTSKT